MEDILKSLAPWPTLQGVVIGLLIAAAGAWAIRKGLQSNRDNQALNSDDSRAMWAAYEQLKNIEENTFDMKDSLRRIAEAQKEIKDAVGRLATVMWNRGQGI